MSDILGINGETNTEDISLREMFPENPDVKVYPVPTSAMRNRAAITSMLASKPEDVISNYQVMMTEGTDGSDITQKQLQATVQENTQKADTEGVMAILSDPSIPIEQKQATIAAFNRSIVLKDPSTTLFTNSLKKGSKGENVEQETARISAADSIREIYDAREQSQGLVNAHAAKLGSDSAAVDLAQMLELYIMPFGNNINVGKVNKALNKDVSQNTSLWDTLKGFIAAGTTTEQLRDRLASLPPEKRIDFQKAVQRAIAEDSGIIFSNENQFAQYDKLQSVFEDDGYGNFQKVLDNLAPILDILGIRQFVKSGQKLVKAAVKGEKAVVPAFSKVEPTLSATKPHQEITDVAARVEQNAVKGRDNPASPAAITQQANPEQARNLHAAVVKSSDDEVAKALYGSTKTDAIAVDVMPQASTASDAVRSKVVDIDRELRKELQPPEDIAEIMGNNGGIYFTPAERASARAHIVNDFQNAEGLVMNNAMSSFEWDGVHANIKAVYGTTEGGFLKPEQALSQAKWALRNSGVLDSDITLLKRDGIDYVPVKLDEVAGIDGSYHVQVKIKREIDPTDISNLEQFDVKWNFFDRIPQFVTDDKGSVSRYLLDAASMLNKVYTGAASVVSDATSAFEKQMLTLATKYSDSYKKLASDRKSKIDSYIKEANYNGVKFDKGDLTARGFTKPEINTLKSWRDFWDAHYYLENHDVVRSLNAQGYQVFKNAQTELYAKPIAKNQNISQFYDPATDSIVAHSKAEGDLLYNGGGTYAKLRRPVDINGVLVEHMIVRNTPTEYLRKLRSSDSVLNYRDGYFQLQYKAPRFVDEYVKVNGKDHARTVAVAGDTAEAEDFARRMEITSGNRHEVRGDDRVIRKDSDAWWDLNSASGRIAQRRRGKLLEDASGLNHLGDGSYIVDPVDSAIRAARSISGRTVSRPMLEAAKARFINQYKEVLPGNGIGGFQYPNSISEIGAKGEQFSKRVADARTTYSYIRYLENGYINGMDDAWKQLFNGLADMFGSKGWSKAERAALTTSENAPTSLTKNGVFMAYIGINPLRQWIIQTHQVVRTFSYNPTGWITGNIPKLMTEYLGSIAVTGKHSTSDFGKFIKESGLLDSVDKSNLVRGTLADAADLSNPIARNVGKGTAAVRKIGFDIGEQGNLLGHAAAVYDRYKRLGKDLTDRAVREEAISEIRAISYDMNFAGDMVYNQTTPAMLLQFMQVPHKAFLQITNRRIPLDIRARMVAADIALWGPPSVLISDLMGVDILPDDPEYREAAMYGFESMALNHMFNSLFSDQDASEKTSVDFSSLAPYDMSGWIKFFHGFYSEGFHETLMNSPAGQLFLKDGGRTQQALSSMGRYFAGFVEEQQKPEDFLSMMNEVLKISSGWNNALKAKLMLESKQKLDQYGSIVDDKTTTVEAWAQAFGFGTSDTRDLYEVSRKLAKNEKQHKEDAIQAYKDIKRYYAEKLNVPSNDPQFMTSVTGAALLAFKDDPKAMEIIRNEWRKDMVTKDQQLIRQMMNASRIPNPESFRDSIKRAPIPDDQKKMIEERYNHLQSVNKKDN